jgi:hypothetical protein
MLPSDARVVELKSWIERRRGDFESMVESIRLARTLDPRNPKWTRHLTETLIVSHRYDEAMVEIENSQFQDYGLSYWHNVLILKEHQDLNRWVETLVVIQQEFEGVSDPFDLWEAHIAVRDYAAAEKLLTAIQERREFVPEGLAEKAIKQASEIVTSWHMKRDDRLKGLLAQARTLLDQKRNSDGDFRHSSVNFDMAIVTAAEGDTEETEHLVRRWRRGVDADLAELAGGRHQSCRVLGMAGATAAVVACIRTGLAEPSFVMPFMEPFLPYYDSMRNEPAFVDLLTEIGDATNNP